MSGIMLSFLAASGGNPYWIATLGGVNTDSPTGIAVDGLDNIYLSAYTENAGAGGLDVLVAKYNTSGVIQWQKVLGDAGTNVGQYVTVDTSGNVYVCGFTSVSGTPAILVAKYDTDGVIQWQRTLNGGNTEDARGIAIDSSGNVYITGFSANNSGSTGFDVIIAKYDNSGTLQWQRLLGGLSTDNDYGISISVDASANVYITGYTSSQGAGGNDALIAKYDTSGTIQWQRILGGSGSLDFGQSLALDSSANVYIAGLTNSTGAGALDVLIAKYNTSGTIQWQRVLGDSSGDAGNGVAVDVSGNVYVTGYATIAGSNDILIAKYNTSGTIQWQRVLRTVGNDTGVSIAIDSLGNICVLGYTDGAGAGGTEIVIAKLPADGSLTGTYGPFTYAVSTLTAATSALTAATSTLNASTATLSAATPSLTSSTSTLTSTKIAI